MPFSQAWSAAMAGHHEAQRPAAVEHHEAHEPAVTAAPRKAKRGDVVAIVHQSSSSYVNGPTQTRTRVHIGEVTSVTREGEVREFRDFEAGAPQKLDRAGLPHAKRYIIPGEKIADKAGIENLVRSRGVLAGSGNYKPFESIEEAHAALKPYVTSAPKKGYFLMDVVTKATGTVTPVEDSKSKHGEFDVILSTAALDRDGDELHADEWKTPLPERITFDSDHGMSVASCVGSGKPFINDAGQLQVRGTFASTPHGQSVRSLVKEGHIDSVSVAFRNMPKTSKDAKPQRELLNGAFVAVPANPEAKVLEVKSADDDEPETKDAVSNWNPDTMNAVADMFQNDPLDGPALEQHIRGIHEMATKIADFAIRLGNGMPYSDPDATPDVLAPSNRSFDSAETKAAACTCSCEGCTMKPSLQKSASTEAPAKTAAPAGTNDDVELLKAKAWADAFMLESLDD